VKANFDKVVLVPVVLEAIKEAPPVHFVIHDRHGKFVVIEPFDKTLKIYDNPLGVLTNAPTFDWHMTNLRNYINPDSDQCSTRRSGDSQARSVWPRQRDAWAARGFHAAFAAGPGGCLFASGAAVENRTGGGAPAIPHPQ
jgi:penicillin V acylase-like amidase (Ntn superfamily)